MPKKRSQLTAADIIRRLPLHRQLDAAQAMLVKLSPAWQSWGRQAVTERRLSEDCFLGSQPSSLQSGVLAVTSNNSANASQIKHQQQSVLEYLHLKGFTEIKQLKVRIEHPTHSNFGHLSELSENPLSSSLISRPPVDIPSQGSLQAIENCEKTVNSDELAKSLNKLANTLKKT